MPGTVHSIVLAVNNPSQEVVERVLGMMSGEGWKAVWCADRASLEQLPPAEHRIRYVALGSTGSLTMSDIAPYISEDLRDVAVFAAQAARHRFGFTSP